MLLNLSSHCFDAASEQFQTRYLFKNRQDDFFVSETQTKLFEAFERQGSLVGALERQLFFL